MKKIIKNIPGFFLWLAVLAICAHLLVPHDHHLVESFASLEESCPASNGNSEHHPGFPVHCHAFNDLASEKAITFVLKKNVQSNNLSFSSFPDTYVFGLQIRLITIFDIREPFTDPYLLELSSLRAPPSLG
ncbi:MAG: hypothetical protein NT144_09555 [Bacteroidia bacterium]|nr:hypothetical protein [Bacteroidia bacterium]